MQVKCIRPRAGVQVGDVAEVPDGAEVSDLYYEPVTPPLQAAASTPPLSLPVSSAPVEEGSPS